jgi:hypothetical protein
MLRGALSLLVSLVAVAAAAQPAPVTAVRKTS